MDEETLLNEFGETINKRILKQIANEIVALSKKQIDELWASVGWREKGYGKNKAFPDWKLEKIKNDKKFAEEQLGCLFQETPKKDFEKLFELNHLTNQGSDPLIEPSL